MVCLGAPLEYELGELHRFVLRPDLSWAAGALFERVDTQLLASLASPTGQAIELRARGPECKALRDVIASDLDALNATFEGLRGKVRKLVPCICSQCRQSTTPERYEEQLLLKRKEERKKLLIECRASCEDVSILELLDGLRFDTMPAWATRLVKLPTSQKRAFQSRRLFRSSLLLHQNSAPNEMLLICMSASRTTAYANQVSAWRSFAGRTSSMP